MVNVISGYLLYTRTRFGHGMNVPRLVSTTAGYHLHVHRRRDVLYNTKQETPLIQLYLAVLLVAHMYQWKFPCQKPNETDDG